MVAYVGYIETEGIEMIKIGKSRYEVTVGHIKLVIFRDSYTGLWRVRQDGGPFDYTGPFATRKEALEAIERVRR
jgi:hypothetical protein